METRFFTKYPKTPDFLRPHLCYSLAVSFNTVGVKVIGEFFRKIVLKKSPSRIGCKVPWKMVFAPPIGKTRYEVHALYS